MTVRKIYNVGMRILNTVHAMDGDSEDGGDEFGAQGQIHHHHQLQLQL